MVARSIAHAERTTSTSVDRGLYLLRYLGTTSAESAPLVHIRASYGSEHSVQFVSAPGAPVAALTQPGAVLVIRADATVNLQITVQASATGSMDANLKLEPIDGVPAYEIPVVGRAAAPSGPAVQALELMAHVSRRGDVSAPSGRWIAGPDAPTPIEAVAARWPSGYGQALEYQVMIDGAESWSPWLTDGRLAGTRGEFRPLVGVRFRLSGVGPHLLKAAALFLGSAVMEKTGASIELRSAAGFDPLVGLLLESATSTRPAVQPRLPDPPALPETRGRVRVFRAGGEQT